MNNPDDIIINLKVIASIQPNDKLNTNGNYLNLETVNIIPQGVKRWWRGDGRDECIKLIDRIINEAKDREEDDVQEALQGSLAGLENLKQTYSKCIQTTARIDTIIDKIST